jgi:hypothetical protein
MPSSPTYRLAAHQEQFFLLQEGDELRCLSGRVTLRHAASDTHPTGKQMLVPSQAWRANSATALTVESQEDAVLCITSRPPQQKTAKISSATRLLQFALRWRRSLG